MSQSEIEYRVNVPLSTPAIVDLFRTSGINRPIDDPARITEMFANSNLVISAWKADQLVGVARSLTDFSFCCYLSDLAVSKDNQKAGIGKKLIELTRERIGPRCTLLLLSAPQAMQYYPKVGFSEIRNGFLIPRTK